jgi:pimeloyl-ACP methyl ester carboxylesterase
VPIPEPRLPDVLGRPPRYYKLHDDVSVNFQLNRWLSWMTPQAVTDVAAIAPRIHGYADFTSAFLELGDRLLAEGRRLDAAFCYRAVEFFLMPGDERKAPARQRFLELVRDVYQIGPANMASVPYEGGNLPAYRFGAPGRGTVVMFGGFDSYVEEFFPMMLAIARSGYQVIGFEGPGQGGALEDSGLVLTREWHRPVGAVLEHFGLDGVTIVGISLCGGLAIRAAAHEPRVARVIADDILTDFLACNLRQFPAGAGIAVRSLMRLRADRLLDALLCRRMRRDLLASWGVSQGEHVLGVGTPHEYLASLARFVTGDVSGQVRADVLLLAGAEDHYVPFHQLTDQINSRYAQLQADVEALDRGVIEAGVTAGHPLAKTAQGLCRRPATTASPVAPSADTEVVWKVLDGAGRELDSGEILHRAKTPASAEGARSRPSAWRSRSCSPDYRTGARSSAPGTASTIPAASCGLGWRLGAGGSGVPREFPREAQRAAHHYPWA